LREDSYCLEKHAFKPTVADFLVFLSLFFNTAFLRLPTQGVRISMRARALDSVVIGSEFRSYVEKEWKMKKGLSLRIVRLVPTIRREVANGKIH
jgi:hypothetical protein